MEEPLGAIALPAPAGLPLPKPGPLHRVLYVIELVGPRTVPAGTAVALMRKDWMASLGQPQIHVMSPADQQWRPMAAGVAAGSYDSIALSWDILSPHGALSSSAAENPLQRAEAFAAQIQRKALPLPPAFEIDTIARKLRGVRENLDIGISLSVHPRVGQWPAAHVHRLALALGLALSLDGSFDWMPPGAMSPLLGVTPLNDSARFDPADQNSPVPGVGIGFSIPRSPSPETSLQGAIHIAQRFAQAFGGLMLDDSDQPLTERGARSMEAGLAQAVDALHQAGITPGSSEALRLFDGA